MNAEVDVVMSTIAADEWLREAVESVLAEASTKLHLVLVLDGIPLEDVAKVRDAWGGDSRVTIVALPERSGLAEGLRVGIASSNAPLIARLDADDVSLPQRFAHQKAFLDRHSDTVAVGSAATLIGSDGSIIGLNRPEPGWDVRRRLVRRNQVLHPSVMFRRSAYELAGGYDSNLARMQDYDLWLRMGMEGLISVMDETLIHYRVHGSQSSRKARPWGPHIDAIVRGQWRLARRLGIPRVIAVVNTVSWLCWQYLRYWGVVSPGYDTLAHSAKA